MKPQAILFDLDGTLWDRTNAIRLLAAEQHNDLSSIFSHISREHYVERIIRLDNFGRTDKQILYRDVGIEFGLSAVDVVRLHADFWERYARHTRPFPEVIATLRRLRHEGIRLGIITNGATATQETKIQHLGLTDLVDAVLISEREGVLKPHPEIFQRALARLGLYASEAWFVGDNPDDDIVGATRAGLRVFWRECSDWPRGTIPCETIRSLDELLPLVAAAGPSRVGRLPPPVKPT